MRATPQHANVLASMPAFAGLGPQEREGFLLFAKVRTLSPGETLFEEGAFGESMFVVLEGELSVRVRTSVGGVVSRQEIARAGAGEMIGEMACLDPAPRSATTVALGPVVLAEVDRTSLSVMEQHFPSVVSHLVAATIRTVSDRLRDADQRIAEVLSGGTSAPSTPPASTSRPPSQSPSAEPESRGWRGFIDKVRRSL